MSIDHRLDSVTPRILPLALDFQHLVKIQHHICHLDPLFSLLDGQVGVGE